MIRVSVCGGGGLGLLGLVNARSEQAKRKKVWFKPASGRIRRIEEDYNPNLAEKVL